MTDYTSILDGVTQEQLAATGGGRVCASVCVAKPGNNV